MVRNLSDFRFCCCLAFIGLWEKFECFCFVFGMGLETVYCFIEGCFASMAFCVSHTCFISFFTSSTSALYTLPVAFIRLAIWFRLPLVLFLESLILPEGNRFLLRYFDWGKLLYPATDSTPVYAIFTLQLWIRGSSGIVQIHDLLFKFQSVRFLVFCHVEHLLCSFTL